MPGFNQQPSAGFGNVNSRGADFKLVSWRQDFLAALLDFALADSGGELSECLFIFPHARPALYLERLIRKDPRIHKPCLMPEIMPVHSVFQKIRLEFAEPALVAGKLDQVGLLLECVRKEQEKNPGSINSLPTGDARAFFPWGMRLANLYEDCFIHGITPGNFLFMEDELAEYAAALLSRLGSIHASYTQALRERNWTTSALTAFEISERLRSGHPLPQFLLSRRIYIAGFYSPNGTEEILFRQLWANGAEVVAHADPNLVHGAAGPGSADPGRAAAHWSCAGLEQWRAAWKTGFELMTDSGDGSRNADGLSRSSGTTLKSDRGSAASGPQISYYSGFDVHSQLAALQTVIGDDSPAGSIAGQPESESDTAVILPDADLLLPVLHHLQDQDLNISMGYPLEKTALARLLESVLAMQENRRHGGYYWKDCIKLLRHPYVKMLENGAAAADTAARQSSGGSGAWRSFLYRLEKSLRDGKRYVDLPAVMRQTLLGLENEPERSEVAELLEVLVDCLLESWQGLTTLQALAASLERLCGVLMRWGERLWPSFPIDAECLYRFVQSVIPQLRGSALSLETLAESVLFTILRQLVRDERVPFDAFPLTALQIMGLLESRLLRFKRVFILEATDDLLPGAAAGDPLLPDSLRRELGLPDNFRKQQMVAYYFFRLVQGAEEVHIFWEEGVEPQGLQEGKKLKSRFVEELLWKEEKKAGKLLEAVQFDLSKRRSLRGSERGNQTGQTSGPAYLQIACAPSALDISDLRQSLGGEAGDLMSRYLTNQARPLSASRINAFLTCPLSFYFQELVRLNPLNEVTEGDDPSETGQLLHESFTRFYGKRLGRVLTNQEPYAPELVQDFQQTMNENQVVADFPQDAQAALRRITPLRLESYLGNQPGGVKVLALETEANAELVLPDGRVLKLTGRLDRLDERPFPQLESVELERDGETFADTERTASGRALNAPEKGLVILDFKTGRLRPPAKGFWSDGNLWARVHSALAIMAGDGESKEELKGLVREIAVQLNHNIQLPLYLYLLRHGSLDRSKGLVCDEAFDTRAVMNAAWVELRDKGEERYLLDEDDLPELREILDEKLPALLQLVLGHMSSTDCLDPERGDHCAYCAYASLCSRLSS